MFQKNTVNYKSISDLPATLTADDLASFLRVSRPTAYNLMRTKGFPTLNIGEKRKVVLKDHLIQWIEQQQTCAELCLEKNGPTAIMKSC